MARYGITVDEEFNLPTEIQNKLTSNVRAEFTDLEQSAVEARDAALQYADSAEQYQLGAEESANIAVQAASDAQAPTDSMVSALIQDEESETYEAITNLSVTNPNLLETLPDEIVVAHRGGLSVYPEMSFEAMEASSRSNFWLEVDVQYNGSDDMVCIHDTTVNRTMEGITGSVSNITTAQWVKARVKPPVPGGKYGKPLMFKEFLQKFGNENILVPEIKVHDTDLAQDVIDAVKFYGLEERTIIQSFNWEICQLIVANGLHALYLFQGTLPPQTPTEIVEAGINFVGPRLDLSASNVSQLKAVGLKVVGYTSKNREDYLEAIDKGFDGVFSDDPWWSADEIETTDTPPALEGYPGSRLRPCVFLAADGGTLPAPIDSVNISGGNYAFTKPYDSHEFGRTRFLGHGWAGDISGDYEITMRVHFTPTDLGQMPGNFGVLLMANSQNPEALPFDGAMPGQNGATFALRRNGALNGWKYVNGAAASSIINKTGTEIAPLNGFGSADLLIRHVGNTYTMSMSTHNRVDTVTVTDSHNPSNMRLWTRHVQTDGYISNLRVVRL